MIRRLYSAHLLFGLALPFFAQGIRGPVMGWVYDAPSRALRQVYGMPGAARLGTAVLSDLEWASVAPSGNRAIVQVNSELRLFTTSDADHNTSGSPIKGAIESPQYSAWAPDSSAIAVYAPASRSIQWIRIRGNSATANAPIPLTGVDGDITSMAGDAASHRITVAVRGKGVYRLGSDGAVLIAPVEDASAIVFEPGGHTMWVADRTTAHLIELANLDSSPTMRTLLIEPDRLADISAVALSYDRQQLYLADRRTNRLYCFDRASASLGEGIELAAPATAMVPLGRGSVLLLGKRAQISDPIYLFIADRGAPPAVFFVPDGEGK